MDIRSIRHFLYLRKCEHMFLTVDIGNTNIKIALFKKDRLICNYRLVTDKKGTPKKYKAILKKLFAKQRVQADDIKAMIICSVVPKLTSVLKQALFLLFQKRALILGKDIVAPIKNLYKRPEQVGQDRLANAVAACRKYTHPIIVVDFGTALTFDLISAKGSYLGGIIVPGMDIALAALSKKADLLPKIVLNKPKVFLGRDTVSSMKSGIVYGYSFMVEAILQQLKKSLARKPYVVATGGGVTLINNFCRSIKRIDENLTLEGLRIILENRNC